MIIFTLKNAYCLSFESMSIFDMAKILFRKYIQSTPFNLVKIGKFTVNCGHLYLLFSQMRLYPVENKN